MKKFAFFCIVLVLCKSACFLVKPGAVYAEAPKIIKFATLAPQGSTWLDVIDDIVDELRDKSEGKLRIKVYAGGISGDEKDVLRKMRMGQLHCAGFTGVGLGEILNEVRVFDLPFFFKEYGEIDHIRNKLHSRFEEEFAKHGYILLGWTEVGFIHFFSNLKIDSLKTLRNSKMWVWEGDPIAKTLFDAIELKPVPLSVTDVMTSLQTGLIDSVYVSPLGAVALQWFSKIKYMLDLPVANAVGAILMTQKYFDNLSPEFQKILKESFRNHMGRLTKLSREDNKESIEVLKSRGVEIISLEKSAVKEFDLARKKACDAVSGKLFPADLIENITTEIEAYRSGKSE